MREDVLVAWIEALRGGRYLQCHERLRHGDRFSALGVLADVLCDERWEDPLPPKWVEHEKHGSCWQFYAAAHRSLKTVPDGRGGAYEYHLPDPFLSPPVYVVGLPRNQWWGLTDEQQEQVRNLNDRFGYSHRRTAAVLEREWLGRDWHEEAPE